MRETKSIPDAPRYAYAESMAHRFLLMTGADRFPVRAEEMMQHVPRGILLFSFTQAREKLGVRDPLHLRFLHADARTVCVRGSGPYITVYEDQLVHSRERIAFSLMHELGHIVLGHLTDFDLTALSRGEKRGQGLYEDQYRVLEREADAFAGEMLAPAAFFRFTQVERDELRVLCGLSEAAAITRMERIRALKNTVPTPEDEELRHLFWPAWTQRGMVLYENLQALETKVKEKYARLCRVCSRCGKLCMDREAEYCVFCGARIRENGEHPQPDAPFLFEGGFCPRCGSDMMEEGEHFCRVCGMPRQNVCLREHAEVPSYARFCPRCGSPTSFCDGLLEAERTLSVLKAYPDNEQWQRYSGKNWLRDEAKREGDTNLYAALCFSEVFMNDDNDLLFLCCFDPMRMDLIRNSDRLLSLASQYEKKHQCMGVYAVRAL